MPNWRKVVVSGSAPTLSGLTSDGNVEITGSLNITGSATIEIPTGDAFTILEGDKDQKSRFVFDYTNGDPTFTIASRASTAKIHIRQDATTNGLYLDEDGQIYVNGSTSDGVKINGSCFASIGTNANALDLGSTSRPWNNIYLRTDAGVVISGGTSSEFLKADGSVDSNTYLTSVGTINLASGVTGILPVANGGTGANNTGAFLMAANDLSELNDPQTARDNLELGSMATQGNTSVNIDGGTITGITDLAIADGGTGASTSTDARNNLGAAKSGANNDITALSGLTTALSVAQGGTGLTELGSANDFLVVNGAGNALEFTSSPTISGVVTTTGAQSIAGNKTFTDEIIMKNGTLTSPGIGFSDGSNKNGFFRFLTDTIGVAIAGNLVAYWDDSSVNSSAYTMGSGVQLRTDSGATSARPALTFSTTETDTGFYRSDTDEISITIGGSQKVIFSAGTSQFTAHLQAHCLGVGTAPSTTQGEIRANGDIIANYSSDRRLKKYIKNIKNPLEKISKINGVTFEWKKTDEKMKKEVHSHEGHDVGVIAQEIEEVLPEVVVTRDNGYKAVRYEKIVPLLIEAIKDLKAEVDELKKSK